ncbi:MAG: aromatic amino acid lyase [Rhodobacteraceae bacterium]|nr:aromatic amino acid lyase [Paracoccaceae bacterium]
MTLSGRGLTIDALRSLAEGRAPIALCPDGLRRMAESHDLIGRAMAENRPIYGVTRGLGARSTEALDSARLQSFSVATIRARAHAVGAPERDEAVRAAMIVRLNTLLTGYSGASPNIANCLLAWLNAGLTPVVPSIGSIGASDLTWNATLAAALIGEGTCRDREGRTGASAAMMHTHGIGPVVLAPRDGLALASNSSATAAVAALALAAAERSMRSAQMIAALSLEAFGANVSPLDPKGLSANPQPGQAEAAQGLLGYLAGSDLLDPVNARRLQDPLSLRNLPQIHGAALAAMATARTATEIEINGASDNPLVLVDTGQILSSGTYFTAYLGLTLETVSRALVHVTVAQLGRMARLLNPDTSGLAKFLSAGGPDQNGFAPVLKTAEALLAEIQHAAQPPAIWPSVNANGIEDCMTTTPVAARALRLIAETSARMTAIEAMIAAQAVDLRGDGSRLGLPLKVLHARIREISAPLESERPLGAEIEAIADFLCRIGQGGEDMKTLAHTSTDQAPTMANHPN